MERQLRRRILGSIRRLVERVVGELRLSAWCRWVAFAAIAGGCRGAAVGEAATVDGDAVGVIDGEPVLASELELHVRPPGPWVGPVRPDPRRIALDDALRVRLFAREARRRGLTGLDGPPAVVQGSLVRALIADELARCGAPDPRAIGDDEARRFYDGHRDAMNPPTSVEVAAIVVADEASATAILRAATTAGDAAFARLVARASIDEASRARGGALATIDEHGAGVEPAIAEVALALRGPGMVGVAEGSDHRWYVLRATRVTHRYQPWPAAAARVKQLMAWQRRQAVLDALVTRLRGEAQITVDAAALARVAVPSRRP